ncbi:MAG: hypothetical protein WBG69_07840, partial [Arcobacteraceae bacterium]
MKYIILSFLIINSLFANSLDIIELYRTQGIKAVEKEIENQLKTKSYWDYSLQNKNIENGYYESIQYVMICQKDMKDIKLYDTKKKEQLFDSNVFVGKEDG